MPQVAPVPAPRQKRTRDSGLRTSLQRQTCDASTQTDSSGDSHWQPRAPRSQATSQTEYRNIPTPPWYHGGLPPLDDEQAYREPPRQRSRREEAPERRERTSRKRRQALTQNEVEKKLPHIDRFSSERNEDAEEFLETLDDKVIEGRLTDFEILGAISTVLRDAGGVPAMTVSRHGPSLKRSLGARTSANLTKRICGPISGTAHKRERRRSRRISSVCVTSCGISRIRQPSDTSRYLRIGICTQRTAMVNRVPMSLDELESWGLQFDKLQKLNCRWSAPPSSDRMHIAYAAPRKQTTRKSAAAASVSGEVVAATWASAPLTPQQPQQQQQRQQRPQQPSPIPQQLAAGVKTKGHQRGGRGEAKNESAPSQHSSRRASSPLPMMDITGQVIAAVAAASTLRPGKRREVQRDTCPLRAIPLCHRHPRSRFSSIPRRSSRAPCHSSSKLHQRSQAHVPWLRHQQAAQALREATRRSSGFASTATTPGIDRPSA